MEIEEELNRKESFDLHSLGSQDDDNVLLKDDEIDLSGQEAVTGEKVKTIPWSAKNCGGKECHGTDKCWALDEFPNNCPYCDKKKLRFNYYLLYRLGSLIEQYGYHLKGRKAEVWRPFVCKIVFEQDPIFSKYSPISEAALYHHYDSAVKDFLSRKRHPKFQSYSYIPGSISPTSEEPETPYDQLYRKICYEYDQKELKDRHLRDLKKIKKYQLNQGMKEKLQELMGGGAIARDSLIQKPLEAPETTTASVDTNGSSISNSNNPSQSQPQPQPQPSSYLSQTSSSASNMIVEASSDSLNPNDQESENSRSGLRKRSHDQISQSSSLHQSSDNFPSSSSQTLLSSDSDLRPAFIASAVTHDEPSESYERICLEREREGLHLGEEILRKTLLELSKKKSLAVDLDHSKLKLKQKIQKLKLRLMKRKTEYRALSLLESHLLKERQEEDDLFLPESERK